MKSMMMVFAVCLVAAACGQSSRFILIVDEKGATLRGRPFQPEKAADPGGCVLPTSLVAVFRLNQVLLLRENEPPVLGMAGTAYRISSDCRSFDEIGKVDLRKTDDQLAAEYGVTGPTLMKPETTSPVKITKDFYQALNSGQIDTAMALVSDNAEFSKWSLTGSFIEGKERVREHLKTLVGAGDAFELRGLRPRMLETTYAYRVLRDGREVAGGQGLTVVSNGRIASDRDDACTPNSGCAPAVLFVRNRAMELRRRTSTSPTECRVSRRDGQETVDVGSDVVVVFRDVTVALDGFSDFRPVRSDDIYRVEALGGISCRLVFLGRAADGQSDDELAAVFGIGVSGGDSVDVPAPRPAAVPAAPGARTAPKDRRQASAGGRSSR